MNKAVIKAASWIDAQRFANDLTGPHDWSAEIHEALNSGNLEAVHWSTLFQSDPGRYGRMDLMSRLGLMAAELLDFRLGELPEAAREQIGVCVETTSGSLATDLKFIDTPRASVFTYTLPSTVIGEICIRYRLRGPVLCLHQGPLGDAALTEARRWLEERDAGACLCLSCNALEPSNVDALDAREIWTAPCWEAAAVFIGAPSGASREHAIVESSVRANSARLCRVAS